MFYPIGLLHMSILDCLHVWYPNINLGLLYPHTYQSGAK